ncbi:unnamed protein product, partial [Effrenium voratum]
GYDQPRLSFVFSTGAAVTVFTQLLLFPQLVGLIGPNTTCFLGLAFVALGLTGFSLFWRQPGHSMLYMLVRMGSGIADTSTATLVAMDSKREDRARNLGLVTSTRAAARIVTPVLSADLFEASAGHASAPGALPYLVASSLAAGLSPVPLMLAEKSKEKRSTGWFSTNFSKKRMNESASWWLEGSRTWELGVSKFAFKKGVLRSCSGRTRQPGS